jgi:phosphotransferase system HPr-like phosphotransfer protein
MGAVAGYLYADTRTVSYSATAEIQASDSRSRGVLTGVSVGLDVDDQLVATVLAVGSPETERAVQAALGSSPIPEASASTRQADAIVAVRVVSETPDLAIRAANAYALATIDQRRALIAQEFQSMADGLRLRAEELQAEIDVLEDEIERAQVNVEVSLALLAQNTEPDESIRLSVAAKQDQAAVQTLEEERDAIRGQLLDFGRRAVALEFEGSAVPLGVTIHEPALTAAAIGPGGVELAILGGLAGLLLALGATYLLDAVRGRVSSDRSLEEARFGIRVLGVVPAPIAESAVDVDEMPRGFFPIARSIEISNREDEAPIKSFLAVEPGHSVLPIVMMTARIVAASGHSVVVIDASATSPSSEPGFTDVIAGDAHLIDCLQTTSLGESGSLAVLPFGRKEMRAQMLTRSSFFVSMSMLRSSYDVVLLNAGSAVSFASLALARISDSVSLVALEASTRRRQVEEVVSNLTQIGARLEGLVVQRRSAREDEFGPDPAWDHASEQVKAPQPASS